MEGFLTAFTLALRNVRRNVRRTVLTLLTILVGSGVIILMNAFAKGGHDQIVRDSVELSAGHVQIHEKGYRENRTVDYAIERNAALESYLSKDPRVAGWTVRIHADALASYRSATSGAQIQGVDPEREKTASLFHTKILPGGRFLRTGDSNAAVIGSTLAKNLGVPVGEAITLISQGFDGSIAADRLDVVGVFSCGNPEYDGSLVLMPLSRADQTFSMNGFVHSYAVRAKEAGLTGELKRQLESFPGTIGREVLGWDEMMPEISQYISLDDASNGIFVGIIFIVVAFGILNTIQMSVFERTRELGVMLSIGTPPGQIVQMVLAESFIISLFGAVLGALAGWGASFYFTVHPLDMSEYAAEVAVYGISTIIYPADATALNISVTMAVTLTLGVLFSLPPALRASRLRAVDAIRHL